MTVALTAPATTDSQTTGGASPRKRDWLVAIAYLAAIAIVLALLLLAQTNRSAAWHQWQAAHSTLPAGIAAPDFTLTALDGQTYRLSALRGQPVLITFFSTQCAPSVRAIANINRLRIQRPDLVILAVNHGQESVAAVQTLADSYAPAYPLLLDPFGLVQHAYHPTVTPAWYFIDVTGRIIAVRFGEHTNDNLLIRTAMLLPSATSLTPPLDALVREVVTP